MPAPVPAPVTPESLPRLAARTMNFRLGVPLGFVVSPDGARVLFRRALTGASRVHGLWLFDVATGTERLVADPGALLAGDERLAPAERARRERARIGSGGIVAFGTDAAVTRATFALSSRLFVVDLPDGAPREIATTAPVVDPRLDPHGTRVAYAGERALHVVPVDGGPDEVVAGPAPDEPVEVVWGLAEFVAGEELGRTRGHWWSPDGATLLVERYDETPVAVWHIADPASPGREPVRVRYPQAGTANALVSLALITPGGDTRAVDWRSDAPLDGRVLEYLVHVEWSGPAPVLVLLTRDQRHLEYREVDLATGSTTLLRTVDAEPWVELLAGTPRRLADGGLLHARDDGDTRRLWRDDEPFTPADVLVHSVIAVDGDAVIARIVPAMACVAVARLGFDGSVEVRSDVDGVAGGAYAGGTLVVSQERPGEVATVTTVTRAGAGPAVIASVAETSPSVPVLHTSRYGTRELHATVLFPTGHVPGSQRLPLLLDPYGGPHGQRVLSAARTYLISQWFADQGFAVVVADGRGVPGRGPHWEQLAHHDRVGTADDQAEVALEVAARFPDDVDATRVGVRGWSFGGYLAALCVLRHPDVFHAAIAGAPTTDERLYDTCYSERYLGHPDTEAAVYDANSLIPLAPQLRRPLMIIHGLADDNVYVAHSLQLSSALLAAGRPHEVLPLSGITHMAANETVAENLLLLQLDFLRRHLDLAPTAAADPDTAGEP